MTHVHVSGTYKRTRYHLQRDCRRLARANTVRDLDVTHPALDSLRPCETCLGTADVGGWSGGTMAKELREMDASDVPALE